MSKPWSNLARVVTLRTYARRDEGKVENWPAIGERVIGGNVRGHNVSESEIQRLRYFFGERKAIPAGRGLWFSGSPGHARLGGVALNNCYGLIADDWHAFVDGQDILMLGGGIGISVEHRFVSKLPRIKKDVKIIHKPTKDADFIVPDSREGWCRLTYKVLESFFVTGRSFSYSTICIRPFGELINGFGGVASGPGALVRFVEKLAALLISHEGRSVRPIDAVDIICLIGEMVVAGNVRRSALLVLGDAHDKDFLRAKRWDLGQIPTHRAMANFTVVCEDIEDLHPLFWKTYEAGEAFGILNRKNMQTFGRMGEVSKDLSVVVNPCQPAWATVLTPSGIGTIGRIKEGDSIWSGDRWTTVQKKWSTGHKTVKEYRTTAGVFYGTENHRVVYKGSKVEAKESMGVDVCVGEPRAEGAISPRDVMAGLVFGDGFLHKATNKVMLCIGKNDSDYHTSEIKDFILAKSHGYH